MHRIVILGGGPAGLAAAIALGERGVPALVVDAAGGAAEPRAELLPQGAAQIVARLGLGAVLAQACRITRVASRWGAAAQHAHGGDPGLGLHGWGIDRRVLAQVMLRRLQSLNVPVQTGRVTAQHKARDGWRLTLEDGGTLSAAFLIDATGRAAVAARRHGAQTLQGQDLVALLWQTPDESTDMLAEATPEGWWYSVPHATGRTLGFVTSAGAAKTAGRFPETCLEEAGRQLSLIPVGGAQGTPRRMDARSARLDRMTGPGWLATGDAAAAFDPLASQGLFNALSGGFFAAHAAADALDGDAEAPLVYEALAARTGERTHRAAHLQYAALPFDTPFWRLRAGLQPLAAASGRAVAAATGLVT